MATESDLSGMTRQELDELAEENHLDPADYSNKADLIEALTPIVDGSETDEEKRERLEARRDQLTQSSEEDEEDSESEAASKPGNIKERPGDPMMDDPDAVQQERFDGTTSDAATRKEGVVAGDVPPDPNSDPNKPSDAENYDFPPAGDVDIATVDEGSGEGEVLVAPTIEDWVVLDGSNESVPEALDGRRAFIINIDPVQDYYTPEEWEELKLTVRTRDDYSATLYVGTDAIKEIHRRGLNPQRN